MSLKNLLDLRKKVEPQIHIVERIIFQKRSLKIEFLKLLAVTAVVSTIIYGISQADTQPLRPEVQSQAIGVYGVISGMAEHTFTLTKKTKPTELTGDMYTVSTANIQKIETKDYASFSLADLAEGDTVIVQGIQDNNIINASRIIFFSHASTTPATATTTPEVATSSVASTTEATSTASTSSGVVESIKDAVSNVVDTLTSSTTATSTETSTVSSTTPEEATTSIQVATTTETTTSDASSTPTIIDKVVDVVTDTVNKVIDIVTQQISPTENSDVQAETSAIDTPASSPEEAPAEAN